MKKILLLFFFALAAHLLHAQRFHRRAVYVNKWYSREIVKTGAKAYCLYLNGMNEAGGGEAIEFGTDVPLFVWEKQYYFLVDADWRLAAAKHSSAGVGGSVAGEFRFYNDARRQASWGMEFSWGVNAMGYISPDDRMNLLYGFNWMRAGLLLPGKWSSSDREYFAQYQCWQGNYYICAGISYDDFYRRSKHWRITA